MRYDPRPSAKHAEGRGVFMLRVKILATGENVRAGKVYVINSFTAGNNAGMKKLCISFCVLLILIATICAAANAGGGAQTEYLRIHVRANSNSAADQSIKYTVKDEVVGFIAPYAAQCSAKDEAMELIGELTDEIEVVCDEALKGLGADYRARAEVRSEHFPTRVYDGVTLEEGEYDALIIELGEGSGDNWWCVLYPPLCFTSASADVQYRSLIKDIIDNFFKRD